MASKKVLLTGFEPFGGASFNPSGAVVEEIAELGINAKVSYSAGSFICNKIFYTAQSFLLGSDVISGFIHLPLATNQTAEFPGLPTMPLADQVAAIKTAIQVSVDV